MDSSAEPDARSDDTTPVPVREPAGNWPGKTTTTVSIGNLLGPAPALVVDLDPASPLDFDMLFVTGHKFFGPRLVELSSAQTDSPFPA